jgi:hypothetical protein
MKEPSVLDFVKSRLFPWKYPRVEIPAGEPFAETGVRPPAPQPDTGAPANQLVAIQPEIPSWEIHEIQPIEPTYWPWRSLLALVLALAGQFSLRPVPDRSWKLGVILLVAAVSCLVWAFLRKELHTETKPEAENWSDPYTVHLPSLLVGMLLSALTFLSFGSLQFSLLNIGMVILTLFFIVRAFWVPSRSGHSLVEWIEAVQERLRGPYQLRITFPWLASLVGVGWVIFFRYYRLSSVPPEMNSDHAEKIMDVLRVLGGQTSIFFPSNGGREALQFYLVAGLHKYLGIPLGFDILKLVTISVGFLTLPFVYLIGKEIANRRVGWLAFLFAGIAYWPNVVSRAALRLPFYMLFTAATLYFLVRGIRNSRRNDFIWAGIALGLSFYGYSADRILPVAVLLALGLYLLHGQSRGRKKFTLIATLALVLTSFIVFLPLLRYIISEPDAFLFRTMTRMGSLEKPLEQPAWQIFLSNLGRALAMFSWDDGEVWVISNPGYPALGVVAGALFYLGVVSGFIRYLRQRNWLDLFWLLSIPTLMLPSILSLAFPHENPNLYRTGGAIVPVFILAALALDSLMTSLISHLPKRIGPRLGWGLMIGLFVVASLQDFNLVFDRYYHQYQLSAWNTSEMGEVGRDFINSFGSPDTVWVVGFPYWVDTRLVAIQAGYPGRDYQIFVDQLESTLAEPRAKLFILNPQDTNAFEALKALYPNGWLQTYTSKVPTKDFLIYVVPPVAQ